MRIMAAAAALTLLAAASPAPAQTDQPKAVTLDGNLTLTSDYRFRGLSRSDRDPAVQGTVNVASRSGLYAGGFASSVGRYVVDGADAEIDLYAGVRRTLGGTVLDGGLLYYAYPGARRSSGSFEPYLSASHTLGPVTARAGGTIAWKQRALGLAPGERRSGLYGYGELSAGIPTTPLTLTARLGRSFRATQATFGERYTDWTLSATYTRGRLSATAAYVDTDRTIAGSRLGARNGDVAGAGVVGSVALTL